MIAAVLRALGIDMGPGGLNHEDAGFFDSRHEIETYVAKRNIKAAWGLKIPELALSLDQFATLLRCPTFILTFRNPVAILDSALVRGGDDFASALSRIDDYFQAMLRFAREATQPVVLVAYERAAAKPVQFIDELAAALNLAPTEDQKRDAKLCVTGDGGGYTHLPAQWHHVAVEPAPEAPCLLKLDEIQESFSDISVVAALEVSSRRETLFHLDVPSDVSNPQRWVQLLVDFGNGFDMLNTYNLYYPQASAIHFAHEGSVRRLAFGFRPAHARIQRVYLQVSD
jgi:hypothetical protein